MRWFKLYTEAKNDAKLRSLTDSQHRVWFNLMCFAAEQEEERGSVIGYDEDLLSVEVAGGDTDLLKATIDKLQRLRIITIKDDGLTFINFIKRQYDKPSDYPEAVRERVSRHREKKRNADVTPCNATEEEVDTDTDITTTTSSEPMIFERECLSVLKQTPNYPFNYEKDLQNVQGLMVEFPDVDILDELKKWAHRKRYDDPLTDKQKPRSQIRNWLLKARGFQKKGVKPHGSHRPNSPDKWANVDLKGLKPAD